MKIRTVVIALGLGALAGCGAEPLGAAAAGASIKQQEVQQGQRTLERAQQRIGQAMELQQQRAARGAE